MPTFADLNGNIVAEDDPKRGLWYSAGCTFWTDDWDALSSFGSGIPCCPHCGAPGMQTMAGPWFEGAALFQSQGNPGYVNFVNASKATCRGRKSTFMDFFQEWIRLHPNGRETNPRSAGD